MNIDANTKVIGRFHTGVSPRGLNIYNPYFEETNTNAVYLLFSNPDPAVLMNGYRSLNLSGAIAAGFESDATLPTLLDEVDKLAQFLGKVGYITTDNGKVTGHVQGGMGMLKTINKAMNPEGKKIVIVGAGNIAKGLLFEMEKANITAEIALYNRTPEKAAVLQQRFPAIKTTGLLTDLAKASGDIFVNLTDIGGSQKEIKFPEEAIKRFSAIVDVTFETEQTDLIQRAQSYKKSVATGWDMFTFQGQVCLEAILDQKIDTDILRKHVVAGLSTIVV